MQGPKNMFEMLVSRFLYVLCWRNKVVIILIILSASVGMLMMLSYHGNKQPGSTEEILRSGKSHVTMRSQASHDVPKAGTKLLHEKGSTGRDDKKLRKYMPKDSALVQAQGQRKRDSHRRNHHGNNLIQGRLREDQVYRTAPYGRAYIEKSAHGTGRDTDVITETVHGYKMADEVSTAQKNVMLRDNVKNPKQDVPIYEENRNRILNIPVGVKVISKGKRGEGNIKEVGGDVRRNEEHTPPKDLSKEIRVEKEKPSHFKGGRAVPGVDSREVRVEQKREIPKKENKVRRKNLDLSALNPARLDKIPKKVNNMSLIDRHKLQEMKVAQLRKKSKIDALLKVLHKRLTTEKPRGESLQSEDKKKYSKKEHSIADGKALSQDKIAVQKLAWKPNSDAKPVWHRDHYHRDENVVVMQDKVINNGAPRFVLRQSTGQNSDRSLGQGNGNGGEVAVSATKPSHEIHFVAEAQRKNASVKTPIPPLGFRGRNVSKMFLAPNISNLFAIAHQHSLKTFKPNHVSFSYRKHGYWPDRMAEWLESEEKYCDGQFVAFNNEFALVKDVIMDRNFCHGRKGGELITDVINQPEEEEYYTYFPGFFQLTCSIQPQYFFNNNNHLNQWLYSVSNTRDPHLYSEIHSEFTILVVRYEYANLYHTMTDWYNAFLLMEFFNKTQSDTNILIVDGHPSGALDSVWSVLFNSSRRISAQSMRTKYLQLVWNILGYNSLMMDHYSPNIPLIEEFRTFFLSSFRITEERKLDCDRINILFIWRRDYVAHPRNPTGSISRKIQNEEELVITLRQNFPTFTVKGIQIDLFEMDQQLKFVTDTDILIGMHGAGLTHAMFLPKHAGMIELLPTYWSAANEHFHAIARWRHIHYRQWTNTNPENEAPNHYTKIPPEVLNSMVVEMVKVVCGLATDPPENFMR